MDKSIIDNKFTAQGVSELPGPVGTSSGAPGPIRRSLSDWTNDERRVCPGATSRSVNTTEDHYSCNESDGEVASGSAKRRGESKGSSRSPKMNTKLLEFSENIREAMKKKDLGTQNISSGRVLPRVMAVATGRDGFLTPVMRGVKSKENTSMVTWSSIAAKSTSESAEGSVSEGDVPMSVSSCSATPISGKLKRLREAQMKSAPKTARSVEKTP